MSCSKIRYVTKALPMYACYVFCKFQAFCFGMDCLSSNIASFCCFVCCAICVSSRFPRCSSFGCLLGGCWPNFIALSPMTVYLSLEFLSLVRANRPLLQSQILVLGDSQIKIKPSRDSKKLRKEERLTNPGSICTANSLLIVDHRFI